VINLRYYIKWNFKERDRPLDRFRITIPEVKVGCACGEDRNCFGGKTVGNRLYGRTRKRWDNDTEVHFRKVTSEDISWGENIAGL
jgi:hypothetical protein